ncbi:phosphoenolpyruvate carboxykinase (ATP), partial [Mariniblastus sp.]|nr:phosphoenolpyruvate carboxykinase (ATP) [Mariniblastus sp.]
MATPNQSRIASLSLPKFPEGILRNAAPARLYEEAIKFDKGIVTSTGGLSSNSGEKTGRSPKDKRIVQQESINDDVWWGEINIPLPEDSFTQLKQQATEFLDAC